MGRGTFHGPSAGCGGSILIGLVITIVVFAAIGAVVLSMYGAADLTQVGSNNATRAYYLAESGYRYATGKFLAMGDDDDSGSAEDDRNDELKRLHDEGARTLAQDQGRFEVEVYPYYVVADGDHLADAISVKTRFPGAKPIRAQAADPDFQIPASAELRIDNVIYSYSSYDPDTGRFFLSAPLGKLEKNIRDGMGIYFVAKPTLSVQLTTGGALFLSNIGWFPPVNGTLRFSNIGGTFRYKYRTSNTVYGIYDRDDPQREFSIYLDRTSTRVMLDPFFHLRAIGTAGTGATETRRSVDFFAQVSTEQTVTVQETFDDASLPNWERDVDTGATTMGSFAVDSIDGDNALKVTGTSEGAAGAPKVSLIAFKPAAAGLDLAAVRTSANDFLSYDAQVKVGFDADPPPENWGFEPSPIPKYFAAGLAFRLDRSDVDGNYYGLSLMRGDNSLSSPYDNIADPIVAKNGRLCLVLWQQTDLGATRNWLAYKDISGAVFEERVEDGENGWTVSDTAQDQNNLWHISDYRHNSASHAWYYGREWQRDYDVGTTRGSLISQPIDLCSAIKSVNLKYASWHSVTTVDPVNYDRRYVEVSDDGGITWAAPPAAAEVPVDAAVSYSNWKVYTLDLSAYAGRTIQVRFRFDSVNAINNNFEGWYVDDVVVEFPVNGATVALRLQEGPSISFSGGAGTTPVRSGDRIEQVGASGTVFGPPILSDGAWGDGDAEGTIVLKNVSGTFQNGVFAVSGTATGGTVTAVRSRDNFIRAYLGSPAGCAGNDVATDQIRRGIDRGEIHWPSADAGDWPAAYDYFTLIQWDAKNPALSNAVLLDPIEAPGSVLRTDTLTSESAGATAPELGLNALGHGAKNVYFDDFSIQTTLGAKPGLPYTIQR